MGSCKTQLDVKKGRSWRGIRGWMYFGDKWSHGWSTLKGNRKFTSHFWFCAEATAQFYKHIISLSFHHTSLIKVINHSIFLMRKLNPKELNWLKVTARKLQDLRRAQMVWLGKLCPTHGDRCLCLTQRKLGGVLIALDLKVLVPSHSPNWMSIWITVFIWLKFIGLEKRCLAQLHLSWIRAFILWMWNFREGELAVAPISLVPYSSPTHLCLPAPRYGTNTYTNHTHRCQDAEHPIISSKDSSIYPLQRTLLENKMSLVFNDLFS